MNAAHDFLTGMQTQLRGGTLQEDHMTPWLENTSARFSTTPQAMIDAFTGQARSPFEADSPGDYLAQRAEAKLADLPDEIAAWTGKEDYQRQNLASRLLGGDANSYHAHQNGRYSNLDEFVHGVVETSAILDTLSKMRDPETRTRLDQNQLAEGVAQAKRAATNILMGKLFLANLRGNGMDTTALEQAFRGELDKYNASGMWDASDANIPDDLMSRANASMSAYYDARQKGQGGQNEAVPVLETVRDILKTDISVGTAETLAGAVRKTVRDQLPYNDGRVSPKMREVLRDPVFEQYGVFNGVLQRLDVEDMLGQNDADIASATGGRYRAVDWQPDRQTMNPDLVNDDRTTHKNIEADIAFRDDMETMSPNVSAALNSMFDAFGGGIHRTYQDITEASNPQAENWRNGWGRTSGNDTREANQVAGVYSKLDNAVVISDSVLGRGRTSVVHHELGHALDSLLGETLTEGGWFTDIDPEFKTFRDKLLKTAQFGKSPDLSLMHWYFRSQWEGSTMHNGDSGEKETFAEGYAAYAWGRKYFAEMPEGSGPITRDTGYALIARALTSDTGKLMESEGVISFDEKRRREVEMGKAIWDYFDALETKRLPEMMKTRRVMGANSVMRQQMSVDLGQSPNGLIEGSVRSVPVPGAPRTPAAPAPSGGGKVPVDIGSLSASDFLELLAYGGNPPPGAEYDKIRMTPAEWAAAFPAARQPDQQPEEVPPDAAVPQAAPAPGGP